MIGMFFILIQLLRFLTFFKQSVLGSLAVIKSVAWPILTRLLSICQKSVIPLSTQTYSKITIIQIHFFIHSDFPEVNIPSYFIACAQSFLFSLCEHTRLFCSVYVSKCRFTSELIVLSTFRVMEKKQTQFLNIYLCQKSCL